MKKSGSKAEYSVILPLLDQGLIFHKISDRSAAQGTQPRQSDEFIVVRRRKSTAQRGSSSVEAEGGEKPPFSVLISGTSTSTTEEIVKEKLLQCARAMNEAEVENVKELMIVGVEHIKLKIPEGEAPRSKKCWRISS